MKFVQELTPDEVTTLQHCMSSHNNYRCRTRSHIILLSNRRYTIKSLSDIFEMNRDTISSCLKAWDTIGIAGLYDENRSGRPHKLTNDIETFIKLEIDIEPRSPKRIVGRIIEEYGISVSVDTVKRVIRRGGKIWKRVRTSLKLKQDPEKFDKAKHEISMLKKQHKLGEINLTYFDASGFSLTPVVPYAWQDINKNILLNSSRSTRYNVLGFMDYDCNLSSFIFEGKTDTDSVIECFEEFSLNLDKKTWVILDNASVHTSAKFKANIDKWNKKGLNLFYLPPYSPELNNIEILWRFIKYKWLPFSSYLNPVNLYNSLADVLKNVGSKYMITFA